MHILVTETAEARGPALTKIAYGRTILTAIEEVPTPLTFGER